MIKSKTYINANAYNDSDSSIEHWQSNRDKLEDLYLSEKYFLNDILKTINTVLDVGCAAGGAFNFCREVNSSLKYNGIDISERLINIAKKKYLEASFLHYDGHEIPYKNNSFELVFSLGVLHHLQHYENIIEQMINKSKKYVLFDLRLSHKKTLNKPERFYQKVNFKNELDDGLAIPYIVLNVDFFKNFISGLLIDSKCRIESYGYYEKPTKLSNIPYKYVYMCSIKIEKNSTFPGVFIDIPKE